MPTTGLAIGARGGPQGVYRGSTQSCPALGVAGVAITGFAGSFSFGMGPVTWVIAGEIFPRAQRSNGLSLCMFTNRFTR
eukprot:783810-Prorocentrum_minimum.AAC.1